MSLILPILKLGASAGPLHTFTFTSAKPAGAVAVPPAGGYFWNASGVLATGAARIARDPENPATVWGMMIEAAATNYVTAPRLLGDASWSDGSNITVSETVTDAGGNANGASRLIASSAGGTLTATVSGLTNGNDYVLSALLKHAIETPSLTGPDVNGEWTVTGVPEPVYVKEEISGTAYPRIRGTAGSLATLEWDWTSAAGGTLFYGSNPTGTIQAIYGVGVVEMTADGSTWQPVNHLYLGQSNWARAHLSFVASGTSATIGFRIEEAGHGVFVDVVQVEDGTRETSPIPSGGATREQDLLALYFDFNTYWPFAWPSNAVINGERYLRGVRAYDIGGGDYRIETDAWNVADKAARTYEIATITPTVYVPQAADLAGGVFVESNQDVGVLADGECTMVFAAETPAAWSTGVDQYLFELNGRIEIYARQVDGDTTRKLQVFMRNAAGGIVWSFRTATALAAAAKFTLELSYKDGVRAQCLLSGASSKESEADNGGTLDLTRNNMTFGARTTGSSGAWNGRVGACWLSDASHDVAAAGFFSGVDPIHWGLRGERPVPGYRPKIMMLWGDFDDDGAWGGTFADGSPTLEDW